MGFQVSPGVSISEIDLTGIVPAVSTTVGAVGGVFSWGPINDRDLISSENELKARFGKPTDSNYETWFTAANFLGYGDALWVSRAASSNAYNAVAVANTDSTPTSNVQIKSTTDYLTHTFSVANNYYYAKWAGSPGNSLKISVCDSANAYSKTLDLAAANSAVLSFTVGSNTAYLAAPTSGDAGEILVDLKPKDFLLVGNTSIGTQFMQIATVASNSTNAAITFYDRYYLNANIDMDSTVDRYWEYHAYVDGAPSTTNYVSDRGGGGDELHIVVVDEDGVFTDEPGTILEVWEGLSRASDAQKEGGGSNYYKDVLNQSSNYIFYANPRSGASIVTAASSTAATTDRAYTASLAGGTDGQSESAIDLGSMMTAYDQFRSAEDVDVSIIMTGKSSSTHGTRGMGLAKYIIENICEYRLDCIAVVSPQLSDVVNNPYQEAESVILTRNQINSTSYAVMDSGYKYQYDRYNNIFRWIPLNGDTAGLMVRTDETRDPWWSPAGLNRGFIKNVVRLAYNPDKADRDLLYKSGVNPVVTMPGQGTLLYGDKTLLTKPSAFDRINVRRLFIVLEKAIATASKYVLFEFNDAFTRARFRNMVEPFLRDVQGRRGIYDFKVVCDETNNPGSVIDRNEFVGDIYIKPARSINFIKLNFIAVGTAVEFNEVVGQF